MEFSSYQEVCVIGPANEVTDNTLAQQIVLQSVKYTCKKSNQIIFSNHHQCQYFQLPRGKAVGEQTARQSETQDY